MQITFRTALTVALLIVAPSIVAAKKPAKKKNVGELERLGPGGMDFLVLGLDAPGFEKLPPREKILAYYLYRAAIAGNDTHYKQNHRHAFAIKQLLETIYKHRKSVAKPLMAAVHDYLKYIWVNHGQYFHRSGSKFVPYKLTFKQLLAAAKQAKRGGAKFDFLKGKTLKDKLTALKLSIFDKKHEPLLTVTTKGVDVVKKSAVNLFDPGVTMAMLKKLPRTLFDKVNVRFALDPKSGKIVPQEFKVGGLYNKELRTVVFWLKKAMPLALTPQQKKSIAALIDYHTRGDEKLFRKHSIHWLKSNTRIDYLASFIEQLKDPRGLIGNWEGMVSYEADSGMIGRIADKAQYFENRMPWPKKYQRQSIKKPVSNVVNALVGTGDMGPVPWAGYNLPNYADIRKDVGSKNVILLNIMQAGSKKDRQKWIQDFYLPQYRKLVKKEGKLFRRMLVYLHEVIGHASGQPDPALKKDPRTVIGRNFSTLEECRADLIALYQFADPLIIELVNKFGKRSFDKKSWRKMTLGMFTWFLQGHMIGLRKVKGKSVKGAHRRAEHTIFNFVLKGGFDGKQDYGAKIVQKRGSYFVQVSDVDKLRKGFGDLLKAIQIIKSTGDAKRANKLFDRFGTAYDIKMRDNIASRANRLKLPKHKAVVFPRLKPVLKNGKVVDVTIHFDQTLTSQQLRYSRLSGNTNLE